MHWSTSRAGRQHGPCAAALPVPQRPPPRALPPAHAPISIEITLRGAMATIDESLSQLEKDVRMLKIEYEQYFGGGKSRPPTDIEWRIETMLKRHGDRGADMNYAQRFRYS